MRPLRGCSGQGNQLQAAAQGSKPSSGILHGPTLTWQVVERAKAPAKRKPPGNARRFLPRNGVIFISPGGL